MAGSSCFVTLKNAGGTWDEQSSTCQSLDIPTTFGLFHAKPAHLYSKEIMDLIKYKLVTTYFYLFMNLVLSINVKVHTIDQSLQ